MWEKKPTAEEEQKAKSFQLPPTFFCGLSTTDGDTDDKADFETEVRKAQQELVTVRGISQERMCSLIQIYTYINIKGATKKCKRELLDFLRNTCHEMGSVDVFLHVHSRFIIQSYT